MKKRILSISGLALSMLLLLVWTAPYLFKGKIIQIIQTRISKNLNAHVNVGGADISWFSHFPKLTIGLTGTHIIGVGEFDGDTLVTAHRVDISFNATSFVFGDSLQVHSIYFEQPRVYAIVHGNGHANWNLAATASPDDIHSGSAKPFSLALERYAVHDGYIRYEDERRNRLVEMEHIDHEGRGDFTLSQFPLKTKTSVEMLTFSQGGALPVRLSARTGVEVTLKVDRTTNTWSFNTDRVKFNELKLHTDGSIQWFNDSSYDMNIRFHTPSSEFKDILSMFSPVYRKNFESIKSSGLVVFNGFIKGKYNAHQNPAYHVNLDIQNGFFQYPDLPMPVQNINIAFHLDNPDGTADHNLLNIRKGHFEINNQPLDFHLVVKNPASKPFIDLGLAGKLDLSNLSKLMKFESGTRVGGLLNADMYAKGNLVEMDKKSKDGFQAGGKLDLNNFIYTSNDYPGGIGLNQLSMVFNSKNTLIREIRGEYRSTHFNANASFNNFFEYLVRKAPLHGSAQLKADEINLREWTGDVHDSSLANNVRPAGSNFLVPSDIDLSLDVETGKLHYDDLDMQHLAGKISVSDETIHFLQCKGDALDGTINFSGTYSTRQGRENPEINMTYDVAGLDLQKSYFTFASLQKLMPVGKYMSGKFNSHLSIAGNLGQNMSPDPKTLHGSGNVFLFDGYISDFAPIDQLFQSLDLPAQRDIILQNVKTDFSFEGGKMVLDPFIVHTDNFEMEIFGKHGFDQTLEYGINLKVNRNKLGSKGTIFVKNVVKEAADKGIPVKLSDAIDVNVKMGGTISNPDIRTDMNATVDKASDDLKKEVDDFVNAKLDSARAQLHKAAAPKKQAVAKASSKSKKSKTHSTAKTGKSSSHKSAAHTPAKKHAKATKKYYSTSLKKQKTTAMNTRN